MPMLSKVIPNHPFFLNSAKCFLLWPPLLVKVISRSPTDGIGSRLSNISRLSCCIDPRQLILKLVAGKFDCTIISNPFVRSSINPPTLNRIVVARASVRFWISWTSGNVLIGYKLGILFGPILPRSEYPSGLQLLGPTC